MKDPITFPNVGRKALIDALKKQGDLDAYADVLFGDDIKAYFDNGFDVLLFYKTMVSLDLFRME